MLTAAGPGPDPGGSWSRWTSCAQIKQCVAPVSSNTDTRRGPDGDQMKPVTIGLKDGSWRCHGRKVSRCVRRARAKASTASWTASVATAMRMAAMVSRTGWSGASWGARPLGRCGRPATPGHRGHDKVATWPAPALAPPRGAARPPPPVAVAPSPPPVALPPPPAAAPPTAVGPAPPPAVSPPPPAAAVVVAPPAATPPAPPAAPPPPSAVATPLRPPIVALRPRPPCRPLPVGRHHNQGRETRLPRLPLRWAWSSPKWR